MTTDNTPASLYVPTFKQGQAMLNERQIENQVERSFIRGAIYSLPAKWKWLGAILIIGGTVVAHALGLI